jgi:putative intracellular protease/amidase
VAGIAFLLDDAKEDSEFRVPYDRLREAGHDVVVLGLQQGKKVHGKHGHSFEVEVGPETAEAARFDAVVVPGGYSPTRSVPTRNSSPWSGVPHWTTSWWPRSAMPGGPWPRPTSSATAP